MGLNAYFSPRWTNRPHAKPIHRPVKYKFEFDYYRQTYCSSERVAHIREKQEKAGKEFMYYFIGFSSN